MPKSLEQWVADDVAPVKDQPLSWLSQNHFFRDPLRPNYLDQSYFFSPADGIILYQNTVEPDEPVLNIKGKPYTVREALRDSAYAHRSVVIGVYMTFYDVHINRVPYSGSWTYKELPPLRTHNAPMLDVEKDIVDALRADTAKCDYLRTNQRVVNRFYSPVLAQAYYVLQVADYDVGCITPFSLKQGRSAQQGSRFGQIRYGSQCELIIPVTDLRLRFMQEPGCHVEAGIDPLVEIEE